MTDTAERPTVVLVDGPSWWADAFSAVSGRSIGTASAAEKVRRPADAEDEHRGLLQVLEALPAGCVIVHTGARGPALQAAAWADREQRPVVAVPARQPDVDAQHARNLLAVEVVCGLIARGWLAKALICVAPDDYPEADWGAVTQLIAALRAAGVYITSVLPVAEPEPVEPPADEEAAEPAEAPA